jgi:hypothetical protein
MTMLFLFVQPVLLQCQELTKMPPKMSCCSSKKCNMPDKKNKDSKDCDRTGACNPFAGCSQAQYTNPSRYFHPENFLIGQPLKKPATLGVIQAGFIVDCWHPPELITV